MSDIADDIWGMSPEKFQDSYPETFSLESEPEQEEQQSEPEQTDELESESDFLGSGELDSESDEDEEEPEQENDDEVEEESSEESEESDDIAKSLLAPITINGIEVPIDSVDEARELMLKGLEANSTKPNNVSTEQKKLHRILKEHGLTSLDKLSVLIDASKGNKAAIRHLLKSHNVDSFELDGSTEEYTPSSYDISDTTLAFDDVIESIQNTPTFDATMETIKGWDEKSQIELSNNPERIRFINEHKQNGVFDLIQTRASQLRMKGQLRGLTDFEVYNRVGSQLAQEGALGTVSKPEPKKPSIIDEKLKSRKQRTAAPKSGRTTKQSMADIDVWSLSKEQLDKMFN